jgi:hypothetical protein
VLGLLGYSGKDSWVAMLFLGSLYFTICYHQSHRLLSVILRNATFVAAILIRPEFVFIAVLFLFIEFLFSSETFAVCLRRMVLNGVAVIGCWLGLNVTIDSLGPVTTVHPETCLYISDLIDFSVAENRLLIPDYYLNGSDIDSIRERYRYPDVNAVFYGEPPNLTIHWPMPEREFLNLRRVWMREILSHPGRAVEHRLSIFKSYLWSGNYFSDTIDFNNDGLETYHKGANGFLSRYLGLFAHGLLQRHFFSFFGCLALIFLLIKSVSEWPDRKWLIAGLVCAMAYQALFSIIGFPPYWRFGSASVLVFWIVFYVVARDFLRLLMKTQRGPVSLF